jgi:hypothetical protein
VNADTLNRSTDMPPGAGTVDVAIPVDELWACFTHADQWSRWNPCMFWVQNRDLMLGDELVWVFEPIRWWYAYKLPARARIVELEAGRKVTWEVMFIPGFYARHTYSLEDLGDGRTRFGSWEKATGPTFRLLEAFWLAHFVFVKDQSLAGAQALETSYQRTGKLDYQTLPSKDYAPSLLPLVLIVALFALLRQRSDRRR